MVPRVKRCFVVLLICLAGSARAEDLRVLENVTGLRGGRLVVALRAEPKTLNPIVAMDAPSREVLGRMHADLISINRRSQLTEPALARSWSVSRDGRTYILRLRRGIRFSDGQPFDADDVLFTFRVFLDEKLHAPQRDLLIVAGKPIQVRKIDAYTVRIELAEPYAAAERLFDGFPMLPRHLLERAYADGTLAKAWGLSAPPAEIAGLGPFRLKEYRPGERLVLQRNPEYWTEDRAHRRLPYLDEIEFLFAGAEDAQITRFVAGETDMLNRVSPRNYALLAKEQAARGDQLEDLGPSLEYNFLVFNLTPFEPGKAPDIEARQTWFRQAVFRKAVSLAIDRESIVRLVYGGRAAPLWGPVTPANKLWIDTDLPHPARSIAGARALLASAGFTWSPAGALLDGDGRPVEFSIAASAGNSERVQMGTIIQDDLKQLGMNVQVAPLEFRSLVDRVLNTRRFDAAIMALGGGDADPNPEMNVWLSSGGMHLWNPAQKEPSTPWEAEMDRLMRRQMSALAYKQRKALYDRVQQIVAENLPLISLASPHVIVAARKSVGNFLPAVLEPNTLWNAEQLCRRDLGPASAK
jgi:peptide/nickel transport system substrate-binding protein